MIDVHAHFAEEGYEFPLEWEKIERANVKKVILASDRLTHAEMHRDFAKTHDGCYFTVGVHPDGAAETAFTPEFFERFSALAKEPKCVAVGEIGLDYHYDGFDRQAQRKLFETQLFLAAEEGLPVEIHSRDACADTLAVLNEHRALLGHGFLMHCYSYGKENLEAFLSLGAYFSFGGVLCFSNARRAVESVEACPLSRILTETDSPYLSPYRGEKNTPANIPVILRQLAKIKQIDIAEAEKATEENAARLFPKTV